MHYSLHANCSGDTSPRGTHLTALGRAGRCPGGGERPPRRGAARRLRFRPGRREMHDAGRQKNAALSPHSAAGLLTVRLICCSFRTARARRPPRASCPSRCAQACPTRHAAPKSSRIATRNAAPLNEASRYTHCLEFGSSQAPSRWAKPSQATPSRAEPSQTGLDRAELHPPGNQPAQIQPSSQRPLALSVEAEGRESAGEGCGRRWWWWRWRWWRRWRWRGRWWSRAMAWDGA